MKARCLFLVEQMLSGWLVATRHREILHMFVYLIPSTDFLVVRGLYLVA
jgi:hypothetical protein